MVTEIQCDCDRKLSQNLDFQMLTCRKEGKAGSGPMIHRKYAYLCY